MPKYVEGAVSPSGKYVVSGGKWVLRGTTGDAAPPDDRPEGYKFAETLHRDERGRTLSFPHMAVPSDPEGRGYAMTALALPAGAALRGVGGAAGKALQWSSTPAGGATIGGIEGARRGPIEAVKGAAVGAVAGPVVRGPVGRVIDMVRGIRGAAPAIAATQAAAPAVVAAEKTVGGMLAAPVAGGTAAKATAGQIIDQMMKWKTEAKLSEAQIIAALRNVYGVPAPYARKLLQMLAGG